MPDKIRLLPDVVANQIAAGEVVNNPSSVVKEMMENAVDAGASSITVNFRDGGKELIQVVDNGCGMSPIDARMAFDRHATSKIKQAEDIYAISTFGFRGEALASIAAVAEVEVRTCQTGTDYGTSVEMGGGVFRDQKMISCPEGTQFFVRNLFYNIPARRRFLEKSTTESRRIKEEFRRVALCNPQIAFQLFENDAPLYNLPPSNLSGRIVGAIGKSIAANLLEVRADTSLVRIHGFVGRPSASKQHNNEQYLFVNGRYFKSAYFQKAILAAYEKLIPSNTKPSYFLYLQIDTERIDVNVHPQKTEVKFEDATALWQIVNAAVRESLGKLGGKPWMDFDVDNTIEIPVARPGIVYQSPDISPNPDFNPFNEAPRNTVSDRFTDYTSSIDYAASQPTAEGEPDYSLIEFIDGEDAWQGTLEIESASFGEPMPIDDHYCATIFEGELLIVDVRRAHEAVLYDHYINIVGANIAASQGLLFPIEVTLTMEECCLARTYGDELGLLGFEFALPDEHMAQITGVPADFTDNDPASLFRELIATLASEENSAREVLISKLAQTMARMASITSRAYTREALAGLLSSLARCTQSNFTPSGLPVALKITRNEIQRRL